MYAGSRGIIPRLLASERALEDEKGAGGDEGEAHPMVEGDLLAEIEHGEGREHGERDHLLHGLELGRRVNGMAPTIGRHRQAILEEGNAPARQDHQPQRPVGELEMPVPGERHEDAGDQQQDDRRDRRRQPAHVRYSALMPSLLIRGTTTLSSLSSMAASSSGVLDLVCAESSAKRLIVAGSSRIFTMASCSFFSTSGGIFAGPNRPV